MSRRFRIHPAIGVARVGNAPDAHFIGPEQPGRPANWGASGFESFRDEKDRIKRQAARFRVFEYEVDAEGRIANPKEISVGGDIAAIEWRVHLANKKAAFFVFNGQSGADDAYLKRSQLPPSHPEKAPQAKAKEQGKKKVKEDPPRPNLRNADISAREDRRRLLEIDPGEQLISTTSPVPVALLNLNEHVPFIRELGELRLDGSRLVVLGGHGDSGSTRDPEVTIDEYANNDTWFDDVGDGPVRARIVLTDGTVTDADPAWVLVGPPDFAPGIGNVVSLFDTMLDIAIQHLEIPIDNRSFVDGPLKRVRALKGAWGADNTLRGYSPSFLHEIYPILSRAVSARWVFDPGEMDRGSMHVQLLDWSQLADPSDAAKPLRRALFERIRNPNAQTIEWHRMPRGLGDDYDHLDDAVPRPSGLLSLTRLQYALLEQWTKGQFLKDWNGSEPDVPLPEVLTPEGLDEAALENCVGGPFYPGIEVSWLVRRRELYSEPFRLKVSRTPKAETADPPLMVGALEFGPGFFSQQMAQPWQADFYDCHKEQRESADNRLHYFMWWTAQRPDDVFPAKSDGRGEQPPWVRRLVPSGMDFDDFESDNERFRQMLRNWHTLRFVIRTADKRFEEEPDA
jgi:hypothetical protein